VTVNTIREHNSTQPKAVFLVLPSYSVSIKEVTTSAYKFIPNEPTFFPMNRNRDSLVQSGIAVVWMGWPSRSEFGISGTSHPDFHKDIASVIGSTRERWPKVPVVLVGSYGGATTALNYLLDQPQAVDGFLALSPYWFRERSQKLESLKQLKTLVLHDTSSECINSGLPEVIEISQRAGFTRVPVNADSKLEIARCGESSAHWLRHADSQWAQTIVNWLEAKPMPAFLGAPELKSAMTERILMVKAKSGQIETSIYTPVGKGPFPLIVFNHGDTEMAHPSVKYQERFRDPVITATFLRWGFAVAIPARPGVGRSDGQYRFTQYSRNDGDPSYKARQHSEAVSATLEGLKGQPDLDMNQIVLAGQSAGGDTVMYMSTLSAAGVRGVINFSGGRSNHGQGENPAFENSMMVNGWGDLGKEAKVPVMLVFAENDSRYSANTVRKAAQAFTDAGGKADLLLLPPTPNDGHFVYQRPTLWQAAVKRFVAGLKLSNSEALAQIDNTSAAAPAPASAAIKP
jgi:dienelactone hydrolase